MEDDEAEPTTSIAPAAPPEAAAAAALAASKAATPAAVLAAGAAATGVDAAAGTAGVVTMGPTPIDATPPPSSPFCTALEPTYPLATNYGIWMSASTSMSMGIGGSTLVGEEESEEGAMTCVL